MITQEYLKSVIDYNPMSGQFTWLKQISSHAKTGCKAGTKHHSGYWQISISGRIYLSHRLAFLYMNGEFPLNCVDHIDGDKGNNTFKNLRIATLSQNQQNRKVAAKNTKSGVLGVSKSGNKWRATIRHSGKNMHIGSYESVDLAHSAYLEAKRKNHEFCTI